jgi:hypothetical protein
VPSWVPDLFIALVLVGAFVVAYRIKDDDPAWKERWDALSPADRTRIARAARSGELLPSQEEIELAAGFARRNRRLRGPYSLMYAVRIPLGIALIAGGMLADSIVFIVFGVLFLLGGLWATRGSYRISRAEREAIARDRSP